MRNILFVSSEYYPFIKTGGLGDAVASLFRAVQISGDNAAILLPGYKSLTDNVVEVIEEHGISIPFSVVIKARLKKVLLRNHSTPVWLLDCHQFFHQPGGIYDELEGQDGHLNTLRFAMLAWSASQLACGEITDWAADIVHCHDWHTALVPVFIKKTMADKGGRARPSTLLTIHNLAFQGHCRQEYLSILGLDKLVSQATTESCNKSFSFLELGIIHADRVSTVSPTYAKEILSEELGCGLDQVLASCPPEVCGILNGVDYNIWHAQTDKALALNDYEFDDAARLRTKMVLQRELGLKQSPKTSMLSFTNRLTHQKMADVFAELIPNLMDRNIQIVAMGEGQKGYVDAFENAAQSYPDQFAYLGKFSEEMEHRIHAGADICLSPSRFEPCGLNPLYAMCYGSIPVVRATGGLCDTIVNATRSAIVDGTANGIVFKTADMAGLKNGIWRALELFEDKPQWSELQKNAMNSSFLWQRAAKEYRDIYIDISRRNTSQNINTPVQQKSEIPFAPLLNVIG